MAAETVCPRCGHVNSFSKARIPDSCVCRVCLSQLDWYLIPGAGPDCRPAPEEPADDAAGPDQGAPGGKQEQTE